MHVLMRAASACAFAYLFFPVVGHAGTLLCPQDMSGGQFVRDCDSNRGAGVNHRSGNPGFGSPGDPGDPGTPTPRSPNGGNPIAGNPGGGITPPGDDPDDPPGGCTSNCGPGTPPGKGKKNNGFGNGDQDAPGKSEFHNRAENKGGNHDGTGEQGHNSR
jgi:hypothetical protein